MEKFKKKVIDNQNQPWYNPLNLAVMPRRPILQELPMRVLSVINYVHGCNIVTDEGSIVIKNGRFVDG